MTKKFFLAIACILVIVSGCDSGVVRGSGRINTEERDIEPFDTLIVDRVYEVTVQQGGHPKAYITADHNITPVIITKVENKILRLDQLKGLQTKNPIKVKLVTPDIKEITHTSVANIFISLVDAKELTVNNKNVGPIIAKGQVGQLNLNVEGEGSAIFSELKARSVRVTSTGAARVDVFASDSVEANNYGQGTITVYGSPPSVKEENKGKGFIDIR